MRASGACAALGLLAASAALEAGEAAALAPFQASYAWSWHGATVAVSTLRLARAADDTWSYDSTSEPRGLGYLYPMRPSLHSVLRVSDQGVQPLSFRATGGGSEHDADVRFDWSAGRATGTYEGSRIDLVLQPGVQDDLSVQIALMFELLRGRTPDQLTMIDRHGTRDYRYQREGSARIATPLGSVDTIIYSSQHPGSPRVTRFWCAPAQGYIPMRVEQRRLDSVEWTMEIRSLERD